MSEIVTGEDTVAAVRALSPETIISFSRGKDSIAAYLAIRDSFERIVPYSYYLVPGLEFVNESIAYFEQKMGCRIVQYPAVATYDMLTNMVYQPKEHIDVIERMNLPSLHQDDLRRALVADYDIDEKAYNAVGMRSSDSVQRAFSIQRNGTINHNRQTYYPVHDWNKQRVVDTIKASGWKLPMEYRYFGSSFDGFYISYLYPIYLYFPRDFQRILEYFPFAEMEVLRYESAVRRGDQKPYVRPDLA